MTTAPADLLLDELDTQLTAAVRLASTRAEHLRLTRLQALAADLRESLLPPVRDPAVAPLSGLFTAHSDTT